jgi:hypothetical protein
MLGLGLGLLPFMPLPLTLIQFLPQAAETAKAAQVGSRTEDVCVGALGAEAVATGADG